MWTPVQWTASPTPQLMQAHGVAAYANVVVATAAGRRVRPIPRMVDRDSLAECTGLHRDSITLGGVPATALDAGIEIRNGDVVFGHPVERSVALLGSRPLRGIFLLLGWSHVLLRNGLHGPAVPSFVLAATFSVHALTRAANAMEAPIVQTPKRPAPSALGLLAVAPEVGNSFPRVGMALTAVQPSPFRCGVPTRGTENTALGVSRPEAADCRFGRFALSRVEALAGKLLMMQFGPSLPERGVLYAVAGR